MARLTGERHASNDRVIRHNGVFRDDDNAVSHVVELMIHVLRFTIRSDLTVFSDPGIFVDDGMAHGGSTSYADSWTVLDLGLLDGILTLVEIPPSSQPLPGLRQPQQCCGSPTCNP